MESGIDQSPLLRGAEGFPTGPKGQFPTFTQSGYNKMWKKQSLLLEQLPNLLTIQIDGGLLKVFQIVVSVFICKDLAKALKTQ